MSKRDIKAGSSYVELLLKDQKFRKGLAFAKKSLITFGKAAFKVGSVMVAAGMAVGTAGVKGFITLGDTLDKMSKRTGVAVESLSELSHAARQSGTTLETVERAIQGMQRRGFDSAKFDEMAASIAAIEDPSLKAKTAMDVWGRAGTQLLPMLDDLPKLRQEARDMGFVMGGPAADSAARLGDMFANLWETLKQGFVAIGQAVAPLLEVALPTIQAFGTLSLKSIQDNSQAIGDTLVGLATFISSTWNTFMEAWRATQTAILSATVYLWDNWATLIETATVSAQLAVVRFAEEMSHTFSERLPKLLEWFGQNWKEVMFDMLDFTAAINTNLARNFANLFKSIYNFAVNGQDWDFMWTELTAGAKRTFSELPTMAERSMSETERVLQDRMNKLGQDLVDGFEEHQKKMPGLTAAFVGDGSELAAMIEAQKELSRKREQEFSLASDFTGMKRPTQQAISGFNAAALAAQGAGTGEDKTLKELRLQRKERVDQHKEHMRLLREEKKLGA